MTAAQVDQVQTNKAGAGANFTAVTWVGQTFVPEISGALSDLEVTLFCAACPIDDRDDRPPIVIDVRTTSGGLPTATVLATTTLTGVPTTLASGPFTVSFAKPAILSAGTAYAFTLHSQAARAAGSYSASSSIPGLYPDGDRVGSTDGGRTWTLLRTGNTLRDLTFRTFMKLTQRIDFAPLAARVIGEADFTIAASASSGLPVSFSASGPCSVSGITVHLASVGPCAITARQDGDKEEEDLYMPADPVTRTFAITYAPDGACLGAPGHQVLSPLNADGSSVVRQNATIPVKFRVCDFNGVSVGTPGVVTSFTLLRGTEGTGSTDVNTEPLSTTPNTAFRWDPIDQQWIFNLSTKNLAAGAAYIHRIALDDGSSIDFTFRLR